MQTNDKKLTRRKFLKTSIVGSGILIQCGKKSGKVAKDSKDLTVKYRTLGRTGIKVSEIGLGTWHSPNESVLNYAIERGLNYIDTAPEYKQGEEERMVGKVVKNKRGKVVLISKIFTTHKSTQKETMAFIEGTMERMQTDYLDIVYIYQVGEILPRHGLTKGIERMQNENVIEALRKAKKEGKIRGFGLSSHGGDLAGYMNYAIDSGIYDVIMMKYNFMVFPQQEEILKKAGKNNVGAVAFKIAGGAADQKIEGHENSRTPEFRRAAIKWTLSNKNVSTCLMRMPTFEEVDNCITALNESFGYNDKKMLHKYASAIEPYSCRWCGECTDACPHTVAIPQIQRYMMYHTNFRHKQAAVFHYGELLPEQQASPCAGCSAPCEGHCPNNIPIKQTLTEAHKTLTA